jgi:nickel-dependent lactate racemase
MQVSFPYPDIKPLILPEQNLLGIFSPAILKAEEAEEKIIERAFSQPIGSAPLPQIMKGNTAVLLIVDDYTRNTPVKKILPRLFKELERGGIKPGRIKILIALGTHRPMTEEEMVKKFGEEILKRYHILNHTWWDRTQLINLGETERGTPIFVNRMIQEVDFIIGIGQIVPHRVSGFSGGGNIIQPGISGEETTGKTHWLSAQFRGREILGKIENPVKQEIESVARKVGLSWIINTIQDGSEKLIGVAAGDPFEAYRKGARQSLEVYESTFPQEADIVIADSHPYNSDLWVASKGIYAAELAVKEGGVVILVTPCPEGVSPSHSEVLELGYHTFAEVDSKVRKRMIQKLTVAAHLVHVGRVIKERAKGILVSHGISKEETERLGFLHARTPQEALEVGFSLVGREGKVAILRRGGEILPVLKNG